jgi:hypothetical protein
MDNNLSPIALSITEAMSQAEVLSKKTNPLALSLLPSA